MLDRVVVVAGVAVGRRDLAISEHFQGFEMQPESKQLAK